MKHLLFPTFFFTVIASNFISIPESVANQAPKQIGHFGDWTAYVLTENHQKVCYMVSLPTSSKGNYKKRGQVYAMVTHRPEEKSHNTVSFHAGYKFAPNSTLKVQIDNQDFALFTHEETAWATDTQDHSLVSAMNKSNTMTIQGTSSLGTNTEDIYSLRGSSKALAAINQACGIQ